MQIQLISTYLKQYRMGADAPFRSSDCICIYIGSSVSFTSKTDLIEFETKNVGKLFSLSMSQISNSKYKKQVLVMSKLTTSDLNYFALTKTKYC